MKEIICVLVLLCLVLLYSNTFAQTAGSQEPADVPVLIHPRVIPIEAEMAQQRERESKISQCVKDYIEKQSRSSRQRVQRNLYDLLHNFDGVVSKLNNKRIIPDNTSFQERLEAVAKLQCELFYNSKILK